jgi:hypothetical protein
MKDRTRIEAFVGKFYADRLRLYQEYFPGLDDENISYINEADMFRLAVLMELRKYTRKESA